MGRRGWAIAVGLLLMGSILASGAAAARASGPEPASATASWLNITATKDYGYSPDTLGNLPVNTTITVVFSDQDVLSHSFTIDSVQGWTIPTSYTSTQLNEFLAAHPPMYDSLLNESGDRSIGSFHSPVAAGWYEFVCTVTGHFQSGMYGFVAFGEPVPSNLTTPTRVGVGGPGVTVADGAALAGVAIVVLIGVVWLARRRRGRPPSE